MKYLCLAYYNEKKFNSLPKTEFAAIVSQCKAHDDELYAGGHIDMVASLAAPALSKSIRPVGGHPLITDGPFAETKEQIGSFFIIEADSLEEAAAEATKHPAAHLGESVGWGVEIRPVEFFKEFSKGGNDAR